MRCELCQGNGRHATTDGCLWWPCIECGGTGRVSCCEGSYRHGQDKDSPWVDWPPEGTNGH